MLFGSVNIRFVNQKYNSWDIKKTNFHQKLKKSN